MIHFKGKGEHSVNELEKICEQQQELARTNQLFKQSVQKMLDDANERVKVLDKRFEEYVSKEAAESARGCDAKRSLMRIFINRLTESLDIITEKKSEG